MKVNQLLSKFVTNKQTAPNNESVLVQCSATVKKDAVTRREIDGKPHIVVSSYTLPDNIVMNGGLYPADEIANSFHLIDGTPAPLGHPKDINGDFVSATDAIALNNYYVGATNSNVTRDNGRVHVEKHIDIEVANRTEQGRELIARIEALETNSNAEPIHTSTGIFLQMEVLSEAQTNDAGVNYTWIARNMQFDHDAILLNEIGASTPDDGVGMAVNKQGLKLQVNQSTIPDGDAITSNIGDAELSHEQIREALYVTLRKSHGDDTWIHRVYSQSFIFEKDGSGYMSVSYVIDDASGEADFVGEAVEVVKDETFTPKFNHEESEIMKDMILNALKAAGVDATDLDDVALLKAYNQLQTNAEYPSPAEPAAEEPVVQDGLEALQAQVNELLAKANAKDTARIDDLAAIVGNSEQYAGITVEDAKTMSVEVLEKMAANCKTATGLPALEIISNNKTAFSAPADLPA